MGFDRIKPPQQRLLERDATPDPEGRAALFTGGGDRPATGAITDGLVLECSRCGAASALDPAMAVRAALPLFLLAPWRSHPLFAVCPAGRHRAWLRVTRAE